jgi:hypothetical protein
LCKKSGCYSHYITAPPLANFHALLPRSSIRTLSPVLAQPLIRLLGHILVQNLALKLGDVIASQVVQCVLLIWARPYGVRYCLNVIADLLINVAVYVGDLAILDAVLVSVVGGDLG